MRKFLLVLPVVLFSFLSSHAQLSNVEAKAAYLLAEDAYGKGDWKKALSYLDECKKKLESTNCKILYLQVMAEAEIAKTVPSYYDSALRSISDFEKAPDLKDFTEEKVLEVMKAKYTIREARDKIVSDARLKIENAEKGSIAMKTISWEGFPFGVSFDELKEKLEKENKPFFERKTNKIKTQKEGSKLVYDNYCYFAENTAGCRGKGLRGVYLQDNIIYGYTGTLDYYSVSVGGLSRSDAEKQALATWPAYYTNLFGFEPTVTAAGSIRHYRWEKDGKSATLEYSSVVLNAENWYVSNRLTVIDSKAIPAPVPKK
ncbi:hypothetical protein GWC95_09260 [Sediminibacterium roseum]|uniref:Tetratricopeptide repeat-containing protein n=1 Tax=Sediminibacterium roseum TaxID=1978412 RepID=A0ABW9ZT01_9BACT|nr:hypothetical protein [Sediminibacterium roseum]NCI50109.1 hypothetical protein [Sediminibacterium roseum]